MVIANKTISALIVMVTFYSFVMNKMKKGMRSWNGILKVYVTNTITVHTMASRSVTWARPGTV